MAPNRYFRVNHEPEFFEWVFENPKQGYPSVSDPVRNGFPVGNSFRFLSLVIHKKFTNPTMKETALHLEN